jgi:hypothetical protein
MSLTVSAAASTTQRLLLLSDTCLSGASCRGRLVPWISGTTDTRPLQLHESMKVGRSHSEDARGGMCKYG